MHHTLLFICRFRASTEFALQSSPIVLYTQSHLYLSVGGRLGSLLISATAATHSTELSFPYRFCFLQFPTHRWSACIRSEHCFKFWSHSYPLSSNGCISPLSRWGGARTPSLHPCQHLLALIFLLAAELTGVGRSFLMFLAMLSIFFITLIYLSVWRSVGSSGESVLCIHHEGHTGHQAWLQVPLPMRHPVGMRFGLFVCFLNTPIGYLPAFF